MSRGQKDILKDLCAYKPSEAKSLQRLPHDCYMIFVGSVNHARHLKTLMELVDQHETEQTSENYQVMKSEDSELILEYITLKKTVSFFSMLRKQHFVYEDHFNSSLFDIIKANASLRKLKDICRHYETRDGVDTSKVMAEHDERIQKSSPYFVEKGLPQEEAEASAFALSFYTGTKSEACNRGASLVARRANGEAIERQTQDELNSAAIILYYLVKALSYIPYHWGLVTRSCQLRDDELQMYMPGSLITWIQFSSSKKGEQVHDAGVFTHRNTYFKIYSLTGRPIREFSNYPEEDEVLFLPHSTFLVFNHEIAYHGQQHTIYMRQVELGLSKWSVLWVDDQIFNENWENKHHMENASAKALNLNVHFIPKSSTKHALSFLRSPFGQRLKNSNTFRIVTDMNRLNEQPSHTAGARLIKEVRQMGFENPCLVFTGNKAKAEQILQSELGSKAIKCTLVSTDIKDLNSFINFEGVDSSSSGFLSTLYGWFSWH
jgi:hypothetical protein